MTFFQYLFLISAFLQHISHFPFLISPVFQNFNQIRRFGYICYKKFAKTDAPMTVKSPATAMARLLIAPSIFPSSIAFDVPMA